MYIVGYPETVNPALAKARAFLLQTFCTLNPALQI